MEDEIEEFGSVNVTRMVKACTEMAVENYSIYDGIGPNKAIESTEFMVGGHRWAIRLYPNGNTCKGYIDGNMSLYLILRSESSTPVKFLLGMHVIDQSGKGNHKGVSLFDGLAVNLETGRFCGFDNFMKRTSIDSPDYLRDNCLKVRCIIGVFIPRINNLPLIKAPTHSIIGANFGKLLENRIGVDVLFKVEKENFWGHKLILAAHSPIFRSLISDCHHSREIVIPDMESNIFKAMLLFIYTGSLPEAQKTICDYGPFMPESFMGKMLAAAHRFELKRLKKLCESHILERVSEESVAYILYLADRYHATELKVACLRFAAENQDAVMESDGCEYLKQTCPSLFLDFAGCKEKPSSGGAGVGVFDFCNNIFIVAKESVLGMFQLFDASAKRKDD